MKISKQKYELDFVNPPKKPMQILLDAYNSKNILIVDYILSTKEHYSTTFQDILDICKYGYEIKEIREREIRFKFHNEDKKIHSIQLRHFLSNLILWYGFMESDTEDMINEAYIHDFQNSNISKITDYLNEMVLPVISDLDTYSKNKVIDEIVHNMTAISAAFLPLIGSGISIYSIHQAEKRNPEISELMRSKLDSSLQPADIESILSERTDRLIDLVSKDGKSDLAPLFKAGNLLSKGQFKEIAVMIGLKSDINGNTIPYFIDKNILIDGISTPSAYYLIALSGRKSLIMSKTKMGEPGAFSKKITTNTTSSVLRQDYQMCNSQRPIWYTIDSDEFLKMLNGRWYFDERGVLKQVVYNKDKDLIGKTLRFKSPCTCSSKDGVCVYCYGALFDLNKDLASAGAYAATKDSEPLGQTILSSKHLQMTHSHPIVFNEEFDKDFELNSDEITLKPNQDDDELFILLNEVNCEETEDTIDYFCTSFDILSYDNKLLYHIEEMSGAKLYLSDMMLNLWKKMKDKSKPISLEYFDDDSAVLFNVEIKNKELTKPIKNINRLLNTHDKAGCKTLDEVLQMLGRMKLDAGIKHDFVHGEMMIRALLRKKSDEMEFPDWTFNGDWNDYQIMRLDDALFKNPSATVSLSYGYLRKQLLSPEFYQKRAGSHLDPLFMENLYDII